jgi:uncharacterized membrane protein (DUF373 family)
MERKEAMAALGGVQLIDGEDRWRRFSHLNPIGVWDRGMKGALSLVILTVLAALTGGTLKTCWEMHLLIDHSVEVVLQQVIINTLMLLALVEVFKTTVAYSREGRVKMTFIADTILIVMLSEVISQWFKGGDWEPLTVLGGTLAMFGVVRIIAVRWSPTLRTGPHQTIRGDLQHVRGVQ